MKNISFFSLLLVCLAALLLHGADASQEDALRAFISSRKKGDTSSTGPFKVRNISDRLASSLSANNSSSVSHKAADKIRALPGQPQGVDFDQYGGYVTVDELNGRALFYYLVEAPSRAADLPLVLWLNGGPGCSSLGYGAMQELGPFRVSQDNKTLTKNLNAWNTVANVLFLESPAGVGYSYSNTTSDYDLSGDQRTADDAYIFLVKWLERFPEYKDRAFYISGESFAGHYVPELAATVLLHNTYNNRTIVNLKGVLVGNPYLDDNINIKGRVDFFWTHGVMSDEVYANVTKYCNFDSTVETPSLEAACDGALDVFHEGQIDAYNIYAPVCLVGPNGKYYPSANLPGYDPCSDIPTYAYLNDPAVQNAFHARATKWQGCSSLHWKDAPMSMLPTVKFLVESKLPVWIFSGDFDSVCPLPATRHTVLDLALPVTTPWRAWTANEEVGGYVQQYAGGFTFLTVRGAGHMVPSFQPERAMTMLSSFLNGVLPA